eukprot:1183193-Prorocentrum_minimum.AAC.1
MDPPPAATVWMSIMGARMRTPATCGFKREVGQFKMGGGQFKMGGGRFKIGERSSVKWRCRRRALVPRL